MNTSPLTTLNIAMNSTYAKSEAVLKLYLRYDAQLHRHYRNCLKDLRDLQAQRLPPDDAPSEPKPPVTEPESPAETTADATVDAPVEAPEPEEAPLTPEQARLQYMQSEIQRFEDYQTRIFRASFPQTQPE